MSLPPDTGSVELRSCGEYVAQLLATGQRLDKRAFDEVRVPTIVRESIHTRSTTHAERSGAKPASPALSATTSSASSHANGLLAHIMYTDAYGSCVTCAVHGVFGPPREQSPCAGRLSVRISAPLLPYSSSSNVHSRDGEHMIGVSNSHSSDTALALLQVESYVQRILESCLDLRQLGIRFGEACWVLVVSVTLLSVDGGLRAAALHAAVAALHELVLPRARLPDESVVEARVLRLTGGVPVACTFGLLRRGARVCLLSDTSAMEEYVLDGSVTVTVDEDGGVVDVCHASLLPVTAEVVMHALRMWSTQSAQMHKTIMNNTQKQRDLRCYYRARQLHLLPQLYSVFRDNRLCHPPFRECLPTLVRHHARHTLLCLHRWLSTHIQTASTARTHSAEASAYEPVSDIQEHARVSEAVDSTAGSSSVAPPPPAAAAANKKHAAFEQEDDVAVREVSEIILSFASLPSDGSGARADIVSCDDGVDALTDAPSSKLTTDLTSVAEYEQPVFYIRPPDRSTVATSSAAAAAVTASETSTSVLFVCMIHSEVLNEEALNTYFGRYGQVSATLHSRLRVRETAMQSHGVSCVPALCHALRSSQLIRPHASSSSASSASAHNSFPDTAGAAVASVGALWLQTFLVTVDSAANAQLAVERAFYRELLFIALHDEAYNCMSMNDVEYLFVHGLGHIAQLISPAQARGRLGRQQQQRKRQRRVGARRVRRSGEPAELLASSAWVSERKDAHDADSDASSSHNKRKEEGDARADTEGEDRNLSEYDEDELGSETDIDDAEKQEGQEDLASEEETWGGNAQRRSGSHRSDRTLTVDFIPDVVIDGFPFWVSEEEVWALVESYGSVRSVHLAIDDLSGAFVGTVMVCMQSLEASVQLCTEVHGSEYKGYTLYCGALTSDLELVDVVTDEVRVAGLESEEKKGWDVSRNTPLWA